MMERFGEDFFKGELREGFFVDGIMKGVWAAQIEVLMEIDRICKRNEIQYFAGFGTLLGAVRHHGYIPWDDDIDITMKREDYQKVLAAALREMPAGWRTVNAYRDENSEEAFTRVVNGERVSLEEGFLREFHGCPYVVGVDIFPLDYIPRDKNEEDVLYLILQHCFGVVWKVKLGNTEGLEQNLQEIEYMCNVRIDREKNLVRQMLLLMDQLAGLYRSEEADKLALLMFRPDPGTRSYMQYKKEWFAESIPMPFENITIPVPAGYEELLKTIYGADYMTPKRYGALHDYPFYQKQEAELAAARQR